MTADPVPAAPRARRGWVLYDAASSAFSTVVAAALGGPLVTGVAEDAAGPDGVLLRVLGHDLHADALFGYLIAATVLAQLGLLPVLGILADRGHRRRVLLVTMTVGALATGGLAAAPGWPLLSFAFVVAAVAAGAANVVYNAFLPGLSPDGDTDRLSSRGFAAGYLGGGLVLAADLVLVRSAGALGIATGTAARLSVASAGLWWLALGVVAVRALPAGQRPDGARVRPSLRLTVRTLRRLPLTARYLLAYLLFNDAIQTVISVASVVVTQELFVARGRDADAATGFVLGLVLLIQGVAIFGALGFGRLARRIGAKPAVAISLVVWSGVVTYAWLGLHTQAQAVGMGVVLALVLGGSQALARSLYAGMVPAGQEASFFSLYALAERGTSWLGALSFAVVVDLTGSYRLAIASLLVLFLAGLAVLLGTDTGEAARRARALDGAPTAPPREGALVRRTV